MAHVHKHIEWIHADGRKVSGYGAAPVGAGWVAHTDRFALNVDGAVMRSYATEEEAQAAAQALNAADAARRAATAKAWAPVNAPISWAKVKGNDGVSRYVSGEGWSIVCVSGAYAPDNGSNDPHLPVFRSLAKAKEWASRCIRGERQERAFA